MVDPAFNAKCEEIQRAGRVLINLLQTNQYDLAMQYLGEKRFSPWELAAMMLGLGYALGLDNGQATTVKLTAKLVRQAVAPTTLDPNRN